MLGNAKMFFDQLSPKTLLRVIPNQAHGHVHEGQSMENELDDLWSSLYAIFTASLWYPEEIPEISTLHDDTSEYDQTFLFNLGNTRWQFEQHVIFVQLV